MVDLNLLNKVVLIDKNIGFKRDDQNILVYKTNPHDYIQNLKLEQFNPKTNLYESISGVVLETLDKDLFLIKRSNFNNNSILLRSKEESEKMEIELFKLLTKVLYMKFLVLPDYSVILSEFKNILSSAKILKNLDDIYSLSKIITASSEQKEPIIMYFNISLKKKSTTLDKDQLLVTNTIHKLLIDRLKSNLISESQIFEFEDSGFYICYGWIIYNIVNHPNLKSQLKKIAYYTFQSISSFASLNNHLQINSFLSTDVISILFWLKSFALQNAAKQTLKNEYFDLKPLIKGLELKNKEISNNNLHLWKLADYSVDFLSHSFLNFSIYKTIFEDLLVLCLKLEPKKFENSESGSIMKIMIKKLVNILVHQNHSTVNFEKLSFDTIISEYESNYESKEVYGLYVNMFRFLNLLYSLGVNRGIISPTNKNFREQIKGLSGKNKTNINIQNSQIITKQGERLMIFLKIQASKIVNKVSKYLLDNWSLFKDFVVELDLSASCETFGTSILLLKQLERISNFYHFNFCNQNLLYGEFLKSTVDFNLDKKMNNDIICLCRELMFKQKHFVNFIMTTILREYLHLTKGIPILKLMMEFWRKNIHALFGYTAETILISMIIYQSQQKDIEKFKRLYNEFIFSKEVEPVQ